MKQHVHISLCDTSWFFYYDHIDFKLRDSIECYLDIMFDNFIYDTSYREILEKEMSHRVDQKIPDPIYFIVGDYIYLWMTCSGCRLVGLN